MGRRLGQHFLYDPSILDRIVAAIDPTPEDVVVEIGAGEGTLTRRLAPRVGHVVAIERDPALAAGLRDAWGVKGETERRGNVTVVEGDALALDWPNLARAASPIPHHPSPLTPPPSPIPHHPSPITPPPSPIPPHPSPITPLPISRFKLIGNIPYQITSPLIEKALAPPEPEVIVFLVQAEVADRVVAPPGSKAYGALTVGLQVAARAERLFGVRAGAFRPPPQVDSAVIRLTPRRPPLVPPGRHAAFRAFVAAVFSQRRKQLGRVLRSAASLDAPRVDALLERLSLDRTRRPETLGAEEFVTLFRELVLGASERDL